MCTFGAVGISKLTTTIAAVSLIAWHGSALAQAEPPIDVEIAGPQEGPPPDGDHFAIGVGAAYMPTYMGSSDYRIQPLPAIDIKYKRFFVNFQDGIGANLIDTESVTIGAGFTMADGYRAKDAPAGVGKLSTGVGARGFVKFRQAGFEAVLGGTKILTGSTEGFVADASLSYPIFVSQRLMLMPSIGTTYGNRKHNNRYFGITPQQSAASGLPQFSVGSGFIDVKAELGAQFFLTDRIGLGLIGGVTRLMDDVRNSPIVEKPTRPFGIAFISYRF